MSTYQHTAECKTCMMNKIIEKSSVKRYTNQLFYFYLCRDKAIVDMFFEGCMCLEKLRRIVFAAVCLCLFFSMCADVYFCRFILVGVRAC